MNTQTATTRQQQAPPPARTNRERAVDLIRGALASVADDCPLDLETRDGIGRDLAEALRLLKSEG